MIVDDLNELKLRLKTKKLKLDRVIPELIVLKNKLAETKKDYDNLYNYNSSSYFTIDKNYIIQTANFQAAILLGIDRKQIHKILFLNFVSANSRSAFINSMDTVKKTQCKQICEIDLLQKGNNKRTVLVECALIKEDLIHLSISDITNNRMRENQLAQLEQSLNLTQYLFQSSKDAIAALDSKLYVIALNRSFSELFAEVFTTKIDVNMSLIMALSSFPILKAKIMGACQEALSGNKSCVIIENHRNEDQIYYYYEISISSLFNQSYQKNELIIQIRNLTEHKLQEKQQLKQQADIAQSSKTRAMGEMASALAHEINQPLTAIIAYSRTCLFIINNKSDQNKTDNELLAPLEKIALQAEHAGEIIHSIKNFMREGSAPPEKTDINCLIKDTLSILNYELHAIKLKITLNLMDDLPQIMTNKTHIMQVILNLAQNSLEALQTAGQENPELLIETCKSKHYIHIHVRDNGPGIADECKDKILNTYFTTKPQGTGLGLGICKTLIEEHAGQLKIQEHEGRGAWFIFTLPIRSVQQNE